MTELERVDKAASLLLEVRLIMSAKTYATIAILIDLALLLLGRRLAGLARVDSAGPDP